MTGRCTLIVTFLDGTKVELARVNRAAALETIDARYRTNLVTSVSIQPWPSDLPVTLEP